MIQTNDLSQELHDENKVSQKETDGHKTKSFAAKFIDFFVFFSLGKYRTPLYYQGEDQYQTIAGAVLSIIFTLVILLITIFTFIPIVQRDIYELNQSQIALGYSVLDSSLNDEVVVCKNCKEFTFEEALPLMFDKSIDFLVRMPDSKNKKDCDRY